MKDLQQIKDEYAIELGYRDFEQMVSEQSDFVIESILDDAAIRYVNEQNQYYELHQKVDYLMSKIESLEKEIVMLKVRKGVKP